MKKIHSFILLTVFFLLGKTAFSQISLSQTTVANYVEAICGPGVSYSNVSLTGDTRAIAKFTGGISGNLGSTMNNGVVLSTGFVNTAAALTGTADKDGNNTGGAISQLTSIADATTYDGIILEFDFIPITGQIDVNFQFGSEEYNWYVESGYNDAFAFFISGPGIAGSQNIALVPSTTTPVTINSINNGYAADWFWGTNDCSSGPCTNCSYYNDNCSSTLNNAMNGYTTVLTASQAVIPCQTYHIRLMLADGGDAALDSWVFIQQDGLYAVGTPPLALAATYPFGSALYEECFNTNTITFTIPVAQASGYTFNVTWSGTATSGVDYSALPTSITIPAGQTSVSLPINVFTDGITEGVETINCTYPISVCETGNAIINIDDAAPLTVNAGPDTDVCGGGSATLSATSANGNGTVSYSWNNGGGNTQTISVLPSSTTTYTVTATDQCGRTETDQVTVAVGTPPVIDAGANLAICSGASATLTAAGGTSYTWDNGLGSGNGMSVSPAVTTTYSVTGTSPDGCTATDAITITVNTPSAVNAGPDQAICTGAAATLSASGAASYSWNNGVTNGVAFNPQATQTYTVTGTDANNCQSTDQVTITVNALPAVNAGPDQSVCAGAQVTLSGTGASSYSWNNGVSNGMAFSPSSTQTYTVTGTGTGGCQNTDQVTVTVNALPSVSAGSDQAVCAGSPVTLSGSGAASYAWNGGVSNGVAFIPSATQSYTVTGTSAAGCQGTDQVVVTVNAAPVVNAGADQSVCAGTQVTLAGSGASTYSWNNGITNNVPFAANATATYTVTGTSAAGCSATDQVTVTVITLPAVNAGADQAICAGETVMLSGSGAAAYSWNNGVSDGVSFTPVTTQTYTLTGTNPGGCTGTDEVTVIVNALPLVDAGSDLTVCAGDVVTMSGSGASTYVWSGGGIDNVPFTVNSTATFVVTGTDANGCVNTDMATVTVLPVPDAEIITSGPLSGLPGLTVSFENGSTDASQFSWSFGNGQNDLTTEVTDSYDITYSGVGIYQVTLTASNGFCESVDEKTVEIILPPVIIDVPNVFTPNGDGQNDIFNLRLENAASANVTVLNRWGNLVAEFDGVIKGWDGTTDGGKDATEGVYFFLYDVKGIDGSSTAGQGYVELFR
jgi:gliding motility-associated-like protein